MNTCYAHSRPGAPIEDWQPLQCHCKVESCLSPCHFAQIGGLVARPLIAHVDSRDQQRIEPLSEHLLAVQKEAHRFGSIFGCGEIAKFLDLCSES